jgi:hypothetical protein
MIIDDIVAAFADCEGWWNPDPNVIPRVTNNPLDLTFAMQHGASAKEFPGNPLTFAAWKTPESGIVGAYRQVLAWTALGFSLRQMCKAQDGSNPNYLSEMQQREALASIDPDTPILELIPPLERPALVPHS